MSEAIIFHCDVEICGSKIKKGKFVRQKEWVGLTDEDLKPLCDEWRIMYGGYVDDFAKAIEAKLKERNT